MIILRDTNFFKTLPKKFNLGNGVILEKLDYSNAKSTSKVSVFLYRHFESYRNMQASQACYIAYNRKSEEVGQLFLNCEKERPNEIHIAWLGVEEDYRNNGYATTMLKNLISWAKKRGIKSIYLEATEMGYPVYKRLGFKDIPKEEQHKFLKALGRFWCKITGMEEEHLTDMILKL